MMATRSHISSQCAISESWTARTDSSLMAPAWKAAIRSGTATMVISSIASRPPKPVRSAESPMYSVGPGLAGGARQGRQGAGPRRGERDRLFVRPGHRRVGGLLDLDQLGALAHLGHDVA